VDGSRRPGDGEEVALEDILDRDDRFHAENFGVPIEAVEQPPFDHGHRTGQVL